MAMFVIGLLIGVVVTVFVIAVTNSNLKNEIEKLKQENERLSKEHWNLINEHAEKEYELERQIELIKEKSKIIEEASKNLSAENEIMRKYYRLDSEPTDEEKIKIRIDLRIHELEMQIIKDRIESLERVQPIKFLSSAVPYGSVPSPWR